MNRTARAKLVLAALFSILWLAATSTSFAQQKKPNIVVIMSDDVGIWNMSAYHRGMMGGRTPNIDRIAAEGALFTITTRSNPVRRGGPHSSLVRRRFGRAC